MGGCFAESQRRRLRFLAPEEVNVRVLVTGLKTRDQHALGVEVSLRFRGQQWERVVWIPWKWLAIEEVDQALWKEHLHQRRSRRCCDTGSLLDLL